MYVASTAPATVAIPAVTIECISDSVVCSSSGRIASGASD